MLVAFLKSKIHMATVTESNLKYAGGITIDSELLEAVDIVPNEKVHVVNINNGARIETYCIPGEAGSGIICMNGATARWAEAGDKLIIMAYALVSQEETARFVPKIISVDDKNRISEK